MNVLFLTLYGFESIMERNLYPDLLREFVKNGHKVFIISPMEKREGKKTHLVKEDNSTILRLQIGDTQKTNIIKKGINTILIEAAFKKAIKQYYSNVKFDLVIYSTPPITLVGAVEFVKKRDGARTYLLLKDIFPQNAVDIGMMSTVGIKGLLYKHFRKKEKRLYAISDRIGCMSPANVEYVLKHNPEVKPDMVEVCPNSIDVRDKSVDEEKGRQIRNKYGLPLDKTICIYGGNLGRPQGIPFLIQSIERCKDMENVFFLIVGDGTEYHLIYDYIENSAPKNMQLMKRLPREDYDTMVGACDIGLIILDHRFTIPNFPSRLLAYMQARIPVLAATDPNTDIGKVIAEGNFGWWCESNDPEAFREVIINAVNMNGLQDIGNNGYNYLINNYSVKQGYETIIKSI